MKMNLVHLRKIYCYFMIFLILYSADSVYSFLLAKYDHIIEIFIDIFLIIGIIKLKKIQIKKIFFSLIVMNTSLLLINFINGRGMYDVLCLIALILRSVCVCMFVMWAQIEKIPLVNYTVRLIVFIAGIYLFLYFLLNVGIIKAVPERVMLGDSLMHTYMYKYNFYYYTWEVKRSYFGVEIPLAGAFWREPGVTQIFYNFALVYYWFINKENHKKIYSVILIAGIISLGSTMGYVLLLALVVVKIWRNDIRLILFYIGLIIPIIYFALNVIAQRYGNIVASSRMLNIIQAFNSWKESPIIGKGYSAKIMYFEGILNYFVHFGILGIYPVWLVMNYLFIKKNNYSLKTKLVLFGWWFSSLINEALGYSMFFFMFYFFLITESFNEMNTVYKKSNKILKITTGVKLPFVL